MAIDYLAESRKAVEEARKKTEASKKAALGYYGGIQMPRAPGVSLPPGTVIGPAQQQRLLATGRAELGAYGQSLAGMFTDPYSGVQAGQRRQIGLGIAGRQAGLPIDIALKVGQANVAAAQARSQIGLGAAGLATQASMAGTRAQLGIAGGRAGIEQAYQYDPGLEYIKMLGYGAGVGEPELGGVGPETPSAYEPIRPGEPIYGGPAPRPGEKPSPYGEEEWERRNEEIQDRIEELERQLRAPREGIEIPERRRWLQEELNRLRRELEQREPSPPGRARFGGRMTLGGVR